LEFLSAVDRTVRLQAAQLTVTLLDPAKPNGLAVDPILHALDAAHRDYALLELLLRALGRSASPRARPYLVDFLLGTRNTTLRIAALEAAGDVGGSELLAVVLPLLDDTNARVRSNAALSLRHMAQPESFSPLWDRLTSAATQDREAVAIALGGALKTVHSEQQQRAILQLILSSRGGVRDALIESVSLLPDGRAVAIFGALLQQSPNGAFKAKIAEALSGQSQAKAVLESLYSSPDARARANAVWSLGDAGSSAEVKLLQAAIGDADQAVAANAVAALARKLPAGPALRDLLCGALTDVRPYVRVNGLVGLRRARIRCADGREAGLLMRDVVPLVRKAAAGVLRDVAGPNPAGDARALARCQRRESDPDVEQACTKARPKSEPQVTEQTVSATVFVVPVGLTGPVANAPFALVRADGFVRCGWTDSRGAVFEPHTPVGRISLAAAPTAAEWN
jgi:HEAT repeat protein